MARTVRLTFLIKTMPKAAQIARYAPDSSLLGVTSLNSHTVSLIDRSFRQLPRTAVGHGMISVHVVWPDRRGAT